MNNFSERQPWSWTLLLLFMLLCDTFSAVNSQTLSSNLPSEPLCPGDMVILTCETRGSPIIAWTSEEYIERGATQLNFATFNSIGATKTSPINPNTTATLTNNTMEDGVQVLVSELRIRALSQFLDSSVTCIHIGSGNTNTTMIQILRDPVGPREVNSTLRQDTRENCIIQFSWASPSNLPVRDIKHYIVWLYGVAVATEIDDDKNGFVSTVYAVCSCNDSYEFSIAAVNRCDRYGPSTPVITSDSPKPLHTLICVSDLTTEPSDDTDVTGAGSIFTHPAFIAVAIIVVLLALIIIIAAIAMIVVFGGNGKKNKFVGVHNTAHDEVNKEHNTVTTDIDKKPE